MLRAAAWSVVVLVAVVPWRSYQPHPHWARVVWVPFTTPPPLTVWDLTINVLLYVPIGYFLQQGRQPRLWRVLAAATVLSVASEATQVYSHGRFPSATDVLLNVTGALAGLFLARRTARLTHS